MNSFCETTVWLSSVFLKVNGNRAARRHKSEAVVVGASHSDKPSITHPYQRSGSLNQSENTFHKLIAKCVRQRLVTCKLTLSNQGCKIFSQVYGYLLRKPKKTYWRLRDGSMNPSSLHKTHLFGRYHTQKNIEV